MNANHIYDNYILAVGNYILCLYFVTLKVNFVWKKKCMIKNKMKTPNFYQTNNIHHLKFLIWLLKILQVLNRLSKYSFIRFETIEIKCTFF